MNKKKEFFKSPYPKGTTLKKEYLKNTHVVKGRCSTDNNTCYFQVDAFVCAFTTASCPLIRWSEEDMEESCHYEYYPAMEKLLKALKERD